MERSIQNMIWFECWPDVSINRNDSELEMFTKYYKEIESEIEGILNFMTNNFDEELPKSKNIAKTMRTKGNKFYENKAYSKAMFNYNVSLSRAPRDSTEFGLALANRSAVLFDIKKYKECLKDIDIVLRSEYPKNLFYKIFLRQSKCYLELNLILEAKKSYERAQESFNDEKKNLGLLQIANVNENIKNLSNEIKDREENPSSNEENIYIKSHFVPILRGGENPKFLSASEAVSVNNNNSRSERNVVAASDIVRGDVLFIEKPYALTLMNDIGIKYIICSFCLENSLTCLPCTTCANNFYCSTQCQSVAWELSHRWECFNERRQILKDIREKLSLSILFKASRDDFKTEIEDISVYGNKDNNFPFMDKMITHKRKVPDSILAYFIKEAVWIVVYLKNFTDYFDWLYIRSNRPEGSKEDLYNIVGGQLVKYLLQTGCNMEVIQNKRIFYQCEEKNAFLKKFNNGVGIYLSSGLLDHSCIPNAACSYNGTVKIVRALKDIKQGSEVTINYLEIFNTEDRQSLLQRYLFRCSCDECRNPKSYKKLLQPFLCRRCRGKALPFRGKNLVKCQECFLIFSKKDQLRRNERKIAQLLAVFDLTGNLSNESLLHTLMKKTYHKDNIVYIAFYHSYLLHYKKSVDFKKHLEVVECLGEITENIFGDTSRQSLVTMLVLTYILVEFTNILKKQNSGLYEVSLNQTNKYLQKSIECLEYYVSPENINKFIANITDCLNTGQICYKELLNDHVEENEFENWLEVNSFLK